VEPNVGDTLVHPQHGTTTVAGFQTRTVRGEEVEYVVLERPEDHLVVHVPRADFDGAGLRHVIDEGDVAALFTVLDDEPSEKQGSWRKRHARNDQRVHSGDPEQIAVALRDLHARQVEDGLSTTDLRLYREAHERLLDEITAATGRDREDIAAEIDRALSEVVQSLDDSSDAA
jgi:CarD family transcriptional regulator